MANTDLVTSHLLAKRPHFLIFNFSFLLSVCQLRRSNEAAAVCLEVMHRRDRFSSFSSHTSARAVATALRTVQNARLRKRRRPAGAWLQQLREAGSFVIRHSSFVIRHFPLVCFDRSLRGDNVLLEFSVRHGVRANFQTFLLKFCPVATRCHSTAQSFADQFEVCGRA